MAVGHCMIEEIWRYDVDIFYGFCSIFEVTL